MKIDSGLALFTLLFVVIIAASVMMGNYDAITPAVTHAKSDLAIGSTWTNGLGTAMTWLFKLSLGATLTGFGVAAFHEAWKAYKLFKRNSQAGRWQSGPNAYWQKSESQGPRLTKNDLMFMSLLERTPDRLRSWIKPGLAKREDEDDEDELDIRF